MPSQEFGINGYTPFCGMPPLPSELWSRWLFEPGLIFGLAVFLAVGLFLAINRLRFFGGWLLVSLLFLSPLCAASMALFSARVGQHLLLTLVAAPLLASALPRTSLPLLPLAVLFAALFWFWHIPAPYAATLSSDVIYWLMHGSLLGSAVVLFMALRAAPEHSMGAVVLTAAQMTLFAVLLTLAPSPWHDVHQWTTIPFGIMPLTDQQFAGALMWVAGGTLIMTLIAITAWRYMNTGELTGSDGKQAVILPQTR